MKKLCVCVNRSTSVMKRLNLRRQHLRNSIWACKTKRNYLNERSHRSDQIVVTKTAEKTTNTRRRKRETTERFARFVSAHVISFCCFGFWYMPSFICTKTPQTQYINVFTPGYVEQDTSVNSYTNAKPKKKT